MRNVVYDIDDVLNNLSEEVYASLGITRLALKQRRFRIAENKELFSDKQIKAIMDAYADEETFKRLKPIKGIERILDVEKMADDVSVHTHSLSFQEAITIVKRDFLRLNVSGIQDSNMSMVVGRDKEPFSNAYIIVEDCLEFLMKYGRHTHKILIDKPHNKLENYGLRDKDVNITRVYSLDEAVDKVEEIIKMGR